VKDLERNDGIQEEDPMSSLSSFSSSENSDSEGSQQQTKDAEDMIGFEKLPTDTNIFRK